MPAKLSVITGTGTAAIAVSGTAQARGPRRLLSVRTHFGGTPTTSENFTITLNSNAGTAYDTILVKNDLAAGSVTDLVYVPDEKIDLSAGDAIDVAYPNTDTKQYGVELTLGLT